MHECYSWYLEILQESSFRKKKEEEEEEEDLLHDLTTCELKPILGKKHI